MTSNYIEHSPGFRIVPIKGYHGFFHLLHDVGRNEAFLIDVGLVGEMKSLGRILQESGLDWTDIKGILLTHGHLDHAGNLAEIKARSGAPIYAHPAEQAHIDGTYPYKGITLGCAALEAFGRLIFRYRSVPIDLPLQAEDELPFWGGLRVVHLPGHTDGHCGFYSARDRLLFSGDLFASYWYSTHLPPSILNSCPEFFGASFRLVGTMDPRLVVPNHYDVLDGELHRRRVEKFLRRAW